MIEKINPHYSMENPATVYDEESLTVLQLVGRTAKKVNEVVEEVNRHEKECDRKHEEFDKSIEKKVDNEVKELLESGAFDQQIEKHTGELKARLDNLVVSGSENTPEVVDIRVTGYQETHATAGDAVRAQFRVLGSTVSPFVEGYYFKPEEWISGGYYSTTNGGRGNSGEYYRSKFLIPFPEEKIPYVADDVNAIITCYDRDLGFLGYLRALCYDGNITPKCTPRGTAYIGVTIDLMSYSNYDGWIKLDVLDTTNWMWLPAEVDGVFNDEWLETIDEERMHLPAIFNRNAYVNANGFPTAAEKAWSYIVFPVAGMKKIYTSAKVQTSGIFFDGYNAVIPNVEYEDMQSVGRVYEVPSNAVFCAINFPRVKDVNGLYYPDIYQYVTFVWKNRPDLPLNGKRVLVVGDSLAWLDGQHGYNDQQPMVGWQAQLRRRGAIVDTVGFNGKQLASTDDQSDILNQITLNNALKDFNLATIDLVVVMAGTNDIRNGVVCGSFIPDYDGADNSQFSFALDYLLYWLANKTGGHVFACTPLWASEKYTSRSTASVQLFANAVKTVAPCEGATAIDVMSGFLAPTTIDSLTYDGTHPNAVGMRKLGKIIYKAMEAKL